MSVFKSYKIEGNDLFLEEYLFWTFSPDQKEAVQVWTLANVDNTDLDKSRLDQLMAYQEDADSEFETINGRIKLTILTWLDSEYIFHCDNLATTRRPYNVEELTEFLVHSYKTYQKQSTVISKQNQFIEKLIKFTDNEIEKKIRIINETNKHNNSNIKAGYQLDTLTQIKTLIDSQMNLKSDTN